VIDLDAVVSCIAAGIYGDDRMSPMERDGALASLSALVEEVKRLEAVNASLVQTSADLCAECGWRFFVPGDGCQKCELDRLREDAVVARSVETTLTVEVERLRTNADARERFLRREGDLLRAAERERDALRREVADLRMLRDEHMLDNQHAYDEGYDAGTRRGYEAECAAVVAWLRVQGMAPYAQSNLDYAATMIERGEHRRTGEEP
jgi:hypothetical protein